MPIGAGSERSSPAGNLLATHDAPPAGSASATCSSSPGDERADPPVTSRGGSSRCRCSVESMFNLVLGGSRGRRRRHRGEPPPAILTSVADSRRARGQGRHTSFQRRVGRPVCGPLTAAHLPRRSPLKRQLNQQIPPLALLWSGPRGVNVGPRPGCRRALQGGRYCCTSTVTTRCFCRAQSARHGCCYSSDRQA
jgi:hypothetical protein